MSRHARCAPRAIPDAMLWKPPLARSLSTSPGTTLSCVQRRESHGNEGQVSREKGFVAKDEVSTQGRGLRMAGRTEKPGGALECPYVDVNCPYACGERVQRRSLEEHKSQRCPLRPFTCQYCNHKATHQKVTKEHLPVCEKYPLPCPNECGKEEIERQHLKGHLEQTCPLEVIQCDFSYAGCGAQLQRRLMSAHMKEGMEAHLSLLSLVVPKLQTIVQQQGDLIKQMVQQMKLQMRRLVTPVDIIMDDFEKHKKSNDEWYSHGTANQLKRGTQVGAFLNTYPMMICVLVNT